MGGGGLQGGGGQAEENDSDCFLGGSDLSDTGCMHVAARERSGVPSARGNCQQAAQLGRAVARAKKGDQQSCMQQRGSASSGSQKAQTFVFNDLHQGAPDGAVLVPRGNLHAPSHDVERVCHRLSHEPSDSPKSDRVPCNRAAALGLGMANITPWRITLYILHAVQHAHAKHLQRLQGSMNSKPGTQGPKPPIQRAEWTL